MVRMLTLYGTDFSDLDYKSLNRELRVQKYLRRQIIKLRNAEIYKQERDGADSHLAWTRVDKITFFDIYLNNLDALITEIEYWMGRRSQPIDKRSSGIRIKAIRERNAKARKACIRENARIYAWEKALATDPFAVSWDKERFWLIAHDRGYQTDEALISDVGKELNLDRARAKMALNSGRFTWGQVLCLGAMMQMTPKEFCDTFLSGYFVEFDDEEYRADYANIERQALLRKVVRPSAQKEDEEKKEHYDLSDIPLEIIEVNSDGSPIDDEEWWE